MRRAAARVRGALRFLALIGHTSVAWAAPQITAPPNDACAAAIAMPAGSFADGQATAGATHDANDPAPHCGNGSAAMSVWYRFTAPASGGTLVVDTFGSDYDTILSAWSGTCGQLTAWPAGCNDDYGTSQSQVTLAVAGGATAYVMVSAYFADGGNLSVHGGFTSASGDVSRVTLGKAEGGDLALSWTASCQNGDGDYEIYEGALGAWSSYAPLACTTAGATAATVTPGADSVYFLVVPRNAGREGSYGRDGAGIERPASTSACLPQARAGCPPACQHDKCVAGLELSPSCDGCVASVCAIDPYCCEAGWDSTCVAEVRTACGSLVCPDSKGACVHGLCAPGAGLTAQCDDPPVDPSCVTAICNQDSFCCSYLWDASCVTEVTTLCGWSCN